MIPTDHLSAEARSARFSRICDAAMRERREQGTDGIGTLSEKWLHQIVKRYLTEDISCHEVRIDDARRFVSDVRVGDHAFEVQTASFAPMVKKIDYYLTCTDLTVTVVHPIPVSRVLCWIDPDTHEISPPRRVPKRGRASDILAELYPLIPYLSHPRLQVRVLLLEVQDFKLLSTSRGSRRRGERFERIPTALLEDLSFTSPSDFCALLPPDLPSPFTVKQFSTASHIRGRDAYSAVRVLAALGLLSPAPPIGRSMAWEKKDLGGETPSRQGAAPNHRGM